MQTSRVLNMLRLFNFCNGLGIMTAGILAIVAIFSSFDVATAFMGTYTTLFGLLLCCFECRIGVFEATVRRNFGFMFSFHGRIFFLFFASTVCLGLTGGSNQWVGILVGIVSIVNCLFNTIVIWCHPGFGKGGISRSGDPTQGYTKGGDEISRAGKTYLKNNPDLAKKAAQGAASGAVSFAQQNPDLAAQAGNAAFSAAAQNPGMAAGMMGAAAGAAAQNPGMAAGMMGAGMGGGMGGGGGGGMMGGGSEDLLTGGMGGGGGMPPANTAADPRSTSVAADPFGDDLGNPFAQ